MDVHVDGHFAKRVRLVDDSWQHVPITMPAELSASVRRIELRPSKVFIPRDRFPGSTDSRELGVQVGEVAVVGGE